MTATILVLAALTLLTWSLVRSRRAGRPFRLAAPSAGRPVDMDRERLLSDLRALPDSRADVETHLRT
ncbi:hypothetical protein GCM10009836_14570 [Pseudonocardia ailaonensis]|uniref:Uncharacterized protein n=1 Tax=Pseudonocardia ailaonensis TaxID=367279 RepID=A0ABN2MSX7_9PSEU